MHFINTHAHTDVHRVMYSVSSELSTVYFKPTTPFSRRKEALIGKGREKVTLFKRAL